MLTLVPWVLMGGGAGMIIGAIAQPMVDGPLLIVGFLVAGFGAGLALADPDLLGDHPDELEERRRRGDAGWQKRARPGGLPPRRRREP